VELNPYSPYVPSWPGQRKRYIMHATRPDAIYINVFWLEFRPQIGRHVEWVCHGNRNAAYIDQTTVYIQGIRKAEKVMFDKPEVQTDWKAWLIYKLYNERIFNSVCVCVCVCVRARVYVCVRVRVCV
jgi:kynurenine formamidase